MRKRRVVMAQVNYQYGTNVFVPYSVGSLQAYAETFPEIRESFSFARPLFLRRDPGEVVRSMDNPSIVGLSCYLWNWEYNKILARMVKDAFPECLVVLGGTHIPDASEGFFRSYPWADILVHHEGEESFAEILRESLVSLPDYSRIPGLSIRSPDGSTVKTAAGKRIDDLSKLPSPYLSGIFDFLVGIGFELNVSQETNRGCPYSCTFCDWGGSSYDKFFPFEDARIIAEFEWFGRNRVEYVFNCDANYGILKRDIFLTEEMVRARERHGGYPRRFRMCTAKNSNDKIFAITKVLNDAGMNKGATLAFQSMDETTLRNVKRSNIKISKFSELMDRYKAAGIATYTELILGMPGETYESSKRGIDVLLSAQADAVNIYVYTCTMLPNSVMSRPAYVEVHGIRSVRMPVLLAHSTPDPDSVTEYNDVIVGTASMPEEEWTRTYLFYWVVQAFHCLGLLQLIAIFFHRGLGMKYSDFYERIIVYFSDREETSVGRQITATKRIVEGALSGGRMDVVNPAFGGIYWPLEEASYLALVSGKEEFYREVAEFLLWLSAELDGQVSHDLLSDLVSYQSAVNKSPSCSTAVVSLCYDLHAYFSSVSLKGVLPEKHRNTVTVKVAENERFEGDLESFAREIVWYGRKGGKFRHSEVSVEY